ncbi:MAG: sigma-70 family RNA polymerase sigma factor [Erysipelotrichaceae bacterium]|nr:sigma-70 family RNA polymerase sigma factor [Erysipelotrichaceae bacterium]MDY5252136.1 sigma-70 family RNA polymerase sigma factor [Erysipelotrichaceae bacterium]
MDLKEKLSDMLKDNQTKYYRLALSYTKKPEDAMDVLQEAIVRAFENYHKLKNVAYMDTWFCRILINESLAMLRKRQKEEMLENADIIVDHRQKDLLADMTLKSALYKLDDNLKHIVILRFYNDMKIEEIAAITDTNVSTVKSRLYKALKILKKEMEDSCSEEK